MARNMLMEGTSLNNIGLAYRGRRQYVVIMAGRAELEVAIDRRPTNNSKGGA